MAAGIALSAGLPPERSPIVRVFDSESTPPLYNDPAQAMKVKAALIGELGAANVIESPPLAASDGIGVFGLAGHQTPVTYIWLGAMNPDRFKLATAAGKELPGMHTSRFEPDPVPTLETGVRLMQAVALALLNSGG
jgi:hypothetical protein